MSNLEIIHAETKEPSSQEKIKQAFLSGQIDFDEFHNRWFELDQTGDHTVEAERNIAMLEDKDVFAKVKECGPQCEKIYYKMLSLSYFHKGQRYFNKEDFEKAHLYALKNKGDSDYQFWINYTGGTLAFFNKDKDGLAEFIIKTQDKRNREILINLLKALDQNMDSKLSLKELYLLAYTQ